MKGFADVPHTGEEIRKTTLKELHEKCGIGSSPEDVVNRVHGSTPDEGSNILLGWKVFEGAGCVCHRANRCLHYCLEHEDVAPIVKKIKGICAHFHRSQKVSSILLHYIASMLFFTTILIHIFPQGYNKFSEIVNALGGTGTKPQVASKTRWAGFLSMCSWVNENKLALIEYEEPSDCVANDDGTRYASHEIGDEDQWQQVTHLVSS